MGRFLEGSCGGLTVSVSLWESGAAQCVHMAHSSPPALYSKLEYSRTM